MPLYTEQSYCAWGRAPPRVVGAPRRAACILSVAGADPRLPRSHASQHRCASGHADASMQADAWVDAACAASGRSRRSLRADMGVPETPPRSAGCVIPRCGWRSLRLPILVSCLSPWIRNPPARAYRRYRRRRRFAPAPASPLLLLAKMVFANISYQGRLRAPPPLADRQKSRPFLPSSTSTSSRALTSPAAAQPARRARSLPWAATLKSA